MEGKEQFDEFLGGTQSLPHEVNIMKLISSRVSEITAMTYSIENPQQTKLVFQKLPLHMRRRVMSHNAKRLPRRLREAHLKQMTKSGLPSKNKRPSRKYRRRPYNLLLEYNRRQRNKVWLETHIWHAKRFHMVDKWGYRIASYANDKCFKANYRAVAKHCLMQDISYYACIEISGPESLLKETLKTHCGPFERTFGAKVYESGNREGTLMFFKKNGYPRFPIGNVHFLWRPSMTDVKVIWIWIHPAFYNDVHTELISNFEFKLQNVENASTSSALEPIYYSNSMGCQMILLKNTLNRFRLYGPLTISVLTDALQLASTDSILYTKNVEEQKTNFRDSSRIEVEKMEVEESQNVTNLQSDTVKNVYSADQSWNIEYYSDKNNFEVMTIQKELWQALKSFEFPSQLPPHIILGFTVLDPRFYLPEKRTKSQNLINSPTIMSFPLTNSNISPIWEMKIRNKVKTSCLPLNTINNLRSECLVPGVYHDNTFNEDIMAKIPILLIQKPGNRNSGLGSGIDIILPAGWAMPFWSAFLYRCTRVGALRESKLIAFQNFNKHSPDINDPDTPAYSREALSTKLELTEKYFRYPPNKRVNFIKLGITSPFFCEWKILMKEWSNSEDFYVLRDHNQLVLLQTGLSSHEIKQRKNVKSDIEHFDLNLDSLPEQRNCLVHIKIILLRKGCPKQFGIICMPTSEDLEIFKNNRSWSGPVEKLNSDPSESHRKMLRKQHLTLLKRLQRQRVRHKKALVNSMKIMQSKVISSPDESNKLHKLKIVSKITQEQSQKMSKLYLPECSKVRDSCSREVMGYITLAHFSFTEAHGIGIGYITLPALIELINKKSNLVLIKNIQTRQYRFARIEILAN